MNSVPKSGNGYSKKEAGANGRRQFRMGVQDDKRRQSISQGKPRINISKLGLHGSLVSFFSEVKDRKV